MKQLKLQFTSAAEVEYGIGHMYRGWFAYVKYHNEYLYLTHDRYNKYCLRLTSPTFKGTEQEAKEMLEICKSEVSTPVGNYCVAMSFEGKWFVSSQIPDGVTQYLGKDLKLHSPYDSGIVFETKDEAFLITLKRLFDETT